MIVSRLIEQVCWHWLNLWKHNWKSQSYVLASCHVGWGFTEGKYGRERNCHLLTCWAKCQAIVLIDSNRCTPLVLLSQCHFHFDPDFQRSKAWFWVSSVQSFTSSIEIITFRWTWKFSVWFNTKYKKSKAFEIVLDDLHLRLVLLLVPAFSVIAICWLKNDIFFEVSNQNNKGKGGDPVQGRIHLYRVEWSSA